MALNASDYIGTAVRILTLDHLTSNTLTVLSVLDRFIITSTNFSKAFREYSFYYEYETTNNNKVKNLEQ